MGHKDFDPFLNYNKYVVPKFGKDEAYDENCTN